LASGLTHRDMARGGSRISGFEVSETSLELGGGAHGGENVGISEIVAGRVPAWRAGRRGPSVCRVKGARCSGGGLLGLLVLAAGCAHDPYQPAPVRVEPPAGQAVFEDCDLGDGSRVPSDFPRNSLAPAASAEHQLACGLSTQLNALGEPSLFPLPRAAEVYRVLWLRSGAHPVSVRFERQGDTGQLRGAQSGGKGLGDPGDLLEESSAVATLAQVQDLVARIEATHLWDPPSSPSTLPSIDSGSLWVFEGARAGQYRVRVFQRDALARDPAFGALGRTLLAASGLHVEGGVY